MSSDALMPSRKKSAHEVLGLFLLQRPRAILRNRRIDLLLLARVAGVLVHRNGTCPRTPISDYHLADDPFLPKCICPTFRGRFYTPGIPPQAKNLLTRIVATKQWVYTLHFNIADFRIRGPCPRLRPCPEIYAPYPLRASERKNSPTLPLWRLGSSIQPFAFAALSSSPGRFDPSLFQRLTGKWSKGERLANLGQDRALNRWFLRVP